MTFALLILYTIVLFLRPQEWYAPLYGFQLVNVVAILTIVATLTTQRPDEGIAAVLKNNKYTRFGWGLLAAVALSQIVRFNVRSAMDGVTFFGKTLILFFLVVMLVNRPQKTRKMMWALILVAAVLCIHAVLQVRTGHGFGNLTPLGSLEEGDLRVQGTGVFQDPNDFAMLFIVALAFVGTLLRLRGSFVSKAPLVSLIPVYLYVIYYTQSRGAIVGFGAMLLAYLWCAPKGGLLRLVITAALVAAVVAFGPSRTGGTVYESSAAGRVLEWGIGNTILKQNPFFGCGFADFYLYSGGRAQHSSFVQCYSELGLIGYFFWFGLNWLVLRGLFRIVRTKEPIDSQVKIFARGLFSALTGYLASAFFLSRTWDPVLFFLLALGIGLIWHVQRQSQVSRNLLDVTGRDLRFAGMLTVASIPAIWIMIKVYWAHSGG